MVIDLSSSSRTDGSFTGRENGQKIRDSYGVDQINTAKYLYVKIPDDVYAVSSSFLQGLLGETIRYRSNPDHDIHITKGFDLTLADAIHEAKVIHHKNKSYLHKIIKKGKKIWGLLRIWICALFALSSCVLTSICMFAVGKYAVKSIFSASKLMQDAGGVILAFTWCFSLIITMSICGHFIKGDTDNE